MNKIIKITVIVVTMILLSACGKATVEPQNASYEPRLVIEGFLTSGKNVDRIFITRNFKVDTDLNNYNLIPNPDDTEVIITDLASGQKYPLSFYLNELEDITEAYWRNEGEQLSIQSGNSYQLDVSAIIKGKTLIATAQTTVPEGDFRINSINYAQMAYRQKNENGNLMKFELRYQRSPGTGFYFTAIQAQNPTLDSFIYDNPYGEVKPEDVNLIDDAFNYEVANHTQTSAGISMIALGWNEFNFYDDYTIIMYAADENYKDFFFTYRNVMEMDGNFHEARFNIEGDGIGVFGSMVADTVTCRVTR